MKPLMGMQVMYVMLIGTGMDYSELDMIVQITVTSSPLCIAPGIAEARIDSSSERKCAKLWPYFFVLADRNEFGER
jgi:hypothetical protein